MGVLEFLILAAGAAVLAAIAPEEELRALGEVMEVLNVLAREVLYG